MEKTLSEIMSEMLEETMTFIGDAEEFVSDMKK